MPVKLRLTSVLGDAVFDSLPDWGGGQVGSLAHTVAPVQYMHYGCMTVLWRLLRG
jgi:hypothetical protein